MTRRAKLPIRYRLILTFGVSMAAVIAGLSAFVYRQTATDLLNAIDVGLHSRAELIVSDVKDDGPSVVSVQPTLIESDRAFVQIAASSGRVQRSTSSISRWHLLPSPVIQSLHKAAFYDRRVPGIDDVARVLAVPTVTHRGRFVVMVGVSLRNRRDELVQLAATLAIAGSAALCLLSVGAWLAIAAALRPVERIRRQAAEISASETGRRLSMGGGKDEIALLGATLNQMLDRIEESVDNERRLVDRASHELRTPLAIQRIDLDVALSGPQTREELRDALASVSQENVHLTRLTEDLLVLSRARGGVLPVQLVETTLLDLLSDARRRYGLLNGQGAQVHFRAPDCAVRVDSVWFRQAVDNLIDNALRHTPPGGRVDVCADRKDGTISVIVEDTGPGFAEGFIDEAFKPFARSGQDPQRRRDSTGLGLAVVNTIARAHGGRAWAQNRPEGGARVTMVMNDGLTDCKHE